MPLGRPRLVLTFTRLLSAFEGLPSNSGFTMLTLALTMNPLTGLANYLLSLVRQLGAPTVREQKLVNASGSMS